MPQAPTYFLFDVALSSCRKLLHHYTHFPLVLWQASDGYSWASIGESFHQHRFKNCDVLYWEMQRGHMSSREQNVETLVYMKNVLNFKYSDMLVFKTVFFAIPLFNLQ